MIQIYYWDKANNKEVSIDGIRKAYPNASIPDNVNLDGLGYYKVQDTPIPSYNALTQGVRYHIESNTHLGITTYSKRWEVYPLTEDEVSFNLADSVNKVKQGFIVKIQEALDSFAKTRGYDSILSACTYTGSNVPQFAQEANRCVQLRDLYWHGAYLILEDVAAGNRPVPESFDSIKDELPALTWE